MKVTCFLSVTGVRLRDQRRAEDTIQDDSAQQRFAKPCYPQANVSTLRKFIKYEPEVVPFTYVKAISYEHRFAIMVV